MWSIPQKKVKDDRQKKIQIVDIHVRRPQNL